MRNSCSFAGQAEFFQRGLLGNNVAKRNGVVVGAGLHHQLAPGRRRLLEFDTQGVEVIAHRTGFAGYQVISLIGRAGGGIHDPKIRSQRRLVFEIEAQRRRFDQRLALKRHFVDQLAAVRGGLRVRGAFRPPDRTGMRNRAEGDGEASVGRGDCRRGIVRMPAPGMQDECQSSIEVCPGDSYAMRLRLRFVSP